MIYNNVSMFECLVEHSLKKVTIRITVRDGDRKSKFVQRNKEKK